MLQIQGLVFDVVHSLSPCFERKNFELGSTPFGTAHILLDIWNNMCGHSVFNLRTDYNVLGSSALVAFLDTIYAGWEPPYFIRFGSDRIGHRKYKRFFDGISYLRQILPPVPIGDDVKVLNNEGWADLWRVKAVMKATDRRFVITSNGYYALCPRLVEKGDLVVVLMGCTTPFILRPFGENYHLVGECYVHGIMQGQALSMLEKGHMTLTDFRIV